MNQQPLTLEIGKKLSPAEAKAFTDEIKHRMYALWNERSLAARSCAISNPARTIRDDPAFLAKLVQLSCGEQFPFDHLSAPSGHLRAPSRSIFAPYVGKISDELVNPVFRGISKF